MTAINAAVPSPAHRSSIRAIHCSLRGRRAAGEEAVMAMGDTTLGLRLCAVNLSVGMSTFGRCGDRGGGVSGSSSILGILCGDEGEG